MIEDTTLMLGVNALGALVFILIVVYHYVAVQGRLTETVDTPSESKKTK